LPERNRALRNWGTYRTVTVGATQIPGEQVINLYSPNIGNLVFTNSIVNAGCFDD